MEGLKISGKSLAGLRGMAPLAALLAGLVFAGAGRAEEGITVLGTGTAKARATQVQIDCSITAEAELASDATVKFRDAKKRAAAAVEALKNPDLAIISEGMTITNAVDPNTQMMIMQRGMAGTGVKPHVHIAEKDQLILSNVDKMEPDALLDAVLKIMDVAKDAGYQVGMAAPMDYNDMQRMIGNSMVTYKLPDGSKLRDEAYKSAFEDAKAKAQQLADISGVKLGRVLSIQDPSPTGVNGEDKSLTNNASSELTRHINLTVQFEIVK